MGMSEQLWRQLKLVVWWLAENDLFSTGFDTYLCGIVQPFLLLTHFSAEPSTSASLKTPHCDRQIWYVPLPI